MPFLDPVVDADALTHGIQLALAPVFLLTGVAGLIGAVATRLARIIDRGRILEDRIEGRIVRDVEAAYRELARLRVRGRLVNLCMLLLTLCAALIGITVMALFLGETTALHTARLVSFSFVGGVVLFILSLLGFFAETLLATQTLRFRTPPQVRGDDQNSTDPDVHRVK